MIAIRPDLADATRLEPFTLFGKCTATSLDRIAMRLPDHKRYVVLQIGDELIQVEAALAGYIRSESASRGVSLSTIYYEEMREQELDIQAAQESLAETDTPIDYSDFRRELGLR